MKRLAGQTKLHLACGDNVLRGWANVDLKTKGPVIGWDLRDRLPVRNDAIELIFCEHFIEHITRAARPPRCSLTASVSFDPAAR